MTITISGRSAATARAMAQLDNALVKALARAFLWRRLLEDDAHVAIDELAATERINPSYVSRLLRLTLLAPDIVEAILDGRQPAQITLATLMDLFPVEWERQRMRFAANSGDNACDWTNRDRNLIRGISGKFTSPLECSGYGSVLID